MGFVRARLLAVPTDDPMSPRRAVLLRSSSYSPSRITHWLSALECALISKDRVLPCFSRNCRFATPLECTFMKSGARKSFKMRTYRKRRGGGSGVNQAPPVFHRFFQLPYALSPLLLTLLSRAKSRGTKTAGVRGILPILELCACRLRRRGPVRPEITSEIPILPGGIVLFSTNHQSLQL